MSERERIAALRPHVLGRLLGGAIGDALGNPVEFLSLSCRCGGSVRRTARTG